MADLQRVQVWAEALIRLHLPAEQFGQWRFEFDNAKKRAGACHYGTKRITVSKYLAARWEDDDIHQTLLHEVAHAIVGPRAGHSALWKHTARELGYVGGTTHSGPTAEEFARWIGVCPSGHALRRHRRPSKPVSCATCSRNYDARYAIRWYDRFTGATG